MKDMTQGSPLGLIFSFSIPLIIGNFFQQLYNLVDSIIVGRFLGTLALGAVGTTASFIFLIIGFIQGVTSGFAILISQKFGASDEEGVKKYVFTSLILVFIFIIILTSASIFSIDYLLTLMNTPDDIYDLAREYTLIIFIGIFTKFLYNMFAAMLRAVGDSKTALYFLIIASILNTFLDVFFIVSLKMGVGGAALATIISQGVSALFCFIYIIKKYPILRINKTHFSKDKTLYFNSLKIGIPMGIQVSIIAIGSIILQSAVNSLGSVVVSSFSIASKIEQIFMQPSVSFGLSMATFSAQNLGAKNFTRIKEGVLTCAKINIILGLLVSFILIVFGKYFVYIFITNPTYQEIYYVSEYLKISAIFFVFVSVIFVFRNTLQGMGYPNIPILSAISELLARSIVAFTLPNYIGYLGVCFANPIAWIFASSILMYFSYKKIKALN